MVVEFADVLSLMEFKKTFSCCRDVQRFGKGCARELLIRQTEEYLLKPVFFV